MSETLSITLPDLPPGWEFVGLWYNAHAKDENERWEANADLRREGPSSDDIRAVRLEARGYGATPQAAVDALLPDINAIVTSITSAAEWFAERAD